MQLARPLAPAAAPAPTLARRPRLALAAFYAGRGDARSGGRGGRAPGRGRGTGRGPPRFRAPDADDEDDPRTRPPKLPEWLTGEEPQQQRTGPSERRQPFADRGGRGGGRASGSGRHSDGAPPRARPPPQPQLAPFEALALRLDQELQEGHPVRREAWERLLSRVEHAEHAERVLELLCADARVRGQGWDWATQGYGQLLWQITQVSAMAGAPEVAEQVLERREALHLTVNKDLVPSLIRKVAAAIGTERDGRDGADAAAVVQRLYASERALRGANSPEALYELSRALRRAEDVGGVRALYGAVVAEGIAVREGLLEDLQRWLAKRGVRA